VCCDHCVSACSLVVFDGVSARMCGCWFALFDPCCSLLACCLCLFACLRACVLSCFCVCSLFFKCPSPAIGVCVLACLIVCLFACASTCVVYLIVCIVSLFNRSRTFRRAGARATCCMLRAKA